MASRPSSARPEKSSARTPKRPKLGQNFLADQQAAERIVYALGDLRNETVLEIGPGKAVMTDILAARTGRLIAIELDRVLAAQLSMKYSRHPNVEIIEADVLDVDLANLIARHPGPLLQNREKVVRAKAIGNLPYYITSEILMRFFRYHEAFSEIVVMVQKEVADRIAAQPGTRDYGLLSATAQLYARVEKLFTLSPVAFNPPPKVHSTVLRLRIEPKLEQLQLDAEAFDKFLKLSFAQKRKTWMNNLKEHFDAAAARAALAAAKLRPDVRAEAVELDKMAAVYHALNHSPHA